MENSKEIKFDENFSEFSDADKKLIEERGSLIKDITKDMEEFRFYMASEKIYHYAWHSFADIILEDSKNIFSTEGTGSISRKQFLLSTLRDILKILHPFMPFLTEEIWQTLGEDKLLMIEEWPAK